MTFCAAFWSPQKLGAAIFASMSANCVSRRAASKMPPQFHRAPTEVFVLAGEFFGIDGHE